MQLSPRGDALWVLYREPAALVELPARFPPPRPPHRLPAPPDSFDLSVDGRAAIASRQDRPIVIVSLSTRRHRAHHRGRRRAAHRPFQPDGKH